MNPSFSGTSRALQTEALSILRGGVMALLERQFGHVELAGSVSLELMMVPDIDLYTRLNLTEAHKLYALAPKLSAQLGQQGFTLARTAVNDEYALPDPAFPDTPGLYGGFTFVTNQISGEVQRTWKLDLWGWNGEQYEERQAAHHDLAEKLKTADRELILSLKNTPGYGKTFFSMDVYSFVLAEVGDSLEDLERFLQARSKQP